MNIVIKRLCSLVLASGIIGSTLAPISGDYDASQVAFSAITGTIAAAVGHAIASDNKASYAPFITVCSGIAGAALGWFLARKDTPQQALERAQDQVERLAKRDVFVFAPETFVYGMRDKHFGKQWPLAFAQDECRKMHKKFDAITLRLKHAMDTIQENGMHETELALDILKLRASILTLKQKLEDVTSYLNKTFNDDFRLQYEHFEKSRLARKEEKKRLAGCCSK